MSFPNLPPTNHTNAQVYPSLPSQDFSSPPSSAVSSSSHLSLTPTRRSFKKFLLSKMQHCAMQFHELKTLFEMYSSYLNASSGSVNESRVRREFHSPPSSATPQAQIDLTASPTVQPCSNHAQQAPTQEVFRRFFPHLYAQPTFFSNHSSSSSHNVPFSPLPSQPETPLPPLFDAPSPFIYPPSPMPPLPPPLTSVSASQFLPSNTESQAAKYEAVRKTILTLSFQYVFSELTSQKIKLFYENYKFNNEDHIVTLSESLAEYIKNYMKIGDVIDIFENRLLHRHRQLTEHTKKFTSKITTTNIPLSLEGLKNLVVATKQEFAKRITPIIQKTKQIKDECANQQYLRYDITRRLDTIITNINYIVLGYTGLNEHYFVIRKNRPDDMRKKNRDYKVVTLCTEKLFPQWEEFSDQLRALKPYFLQGNTIIENWLTQTESLRRQIEWSLFSQQSCPQTVSSIEIPSSPNPEPRDGEEPVSDNDYFKSNFHKKLEQLRISIAAHSEFMKRIITFVQANKIDQAAQKKAEALKSSIQVAIQTAREMLSSSTEMTPDHFEMCQKTIDCFQKTLEKYDTSSAILTFDEESLIDTFELGRRQWQLDGASVSKLAKQFLGEIGSLNHLNKSF